MKHPKIYNIFIILNLLFQTNTLPGHTQTLARDKEKALSIEISFARTNILGQTFPGMSGHYIFFLTERFGTGLSLFTVQNQVDQNFGYSLVNPQLLLSQYGWINQFILINNKYVKLKFNFINGLIQVRLIDESRPSISGQIMAPPKLDSNFYYFMEPGTALSLRLFGLLYLTGGINYRFLFGKSHFSDRKEFQNTGYSLGLSMINNRK